MGIKVSATGGKFKLSQDKVSWHDSRRAEIEAPEEEKGVSLLIPDILELRFPRPLGSMGNLTFRYKPQGPAVFDSVTLSVHLCDRVGIMGFNGCCTTILLRPLVGSLE